MSWKENISTVLHKSPKRLKVFHILTTRLFKPAYWFVFDTLLHHSVLHWWSHSCQQISELCSLGLKIAALLVIGSVLDSPSVKEWKEVTASQQQPSMCSSFVSLNPKISFVVSPKLLKDGIWLGSQISSKKQCRSLRRNSSAWEFQCEHWPSGMQH